MYASTYHKATSVEEAVKALKGAEDGALLAGGQTLIQTMKQHLAAPSDLIDIRSIPEMLGIGVSDGHVTIGAAVTHAEVAGSKDVQAHIPGLARQAAWVGDPSVRHMGTLGGAIANNDPSADYPAGVLALNATIVTDRREIAADDFFEGLFTTALEEDEIILRLRFPIPKASNYRKFRNPASRYAMVGVFVVRNDDGVRLAVTGTGIDGVFRHEGMEAALSADFSAKALDAVDVDPALMMADMHGDATYRAHLVKVMAKRAVEDLTGG